MDIPVKLPGMEGQNIAVRSAGAFSGARLVLNGEPIVKQKGFFQLRSKTGSVLAVKFKSRFLDPIPNLEVGGMTIQVVPALQWYQYIWMGLPIVLLFMGGAIGGFCGGLAATTSSHIFRSERTESTKYALTGLISLGAFFTYFVIVATVMKAFQK